MFSYKQSLYVYSILLFGTPPLLINPFLIHNLLFYRFDRVCRFDINRNGLSRQCLDKNLHRLLLFLPK